MYMHVYTCVVNEGTRGVSRDAVSTLATKRPAGSLKLSAQALTGDEHLVRLGCVAFCVANEDNAAARAVGALTTTSTAYLVTTGGAAAARPSGAATNVSDLCSQHDHTVVSQHNRDRIAADVSHCVCMMEPRTALDRP